MFCQSVVAQEQCKVLLDVGFENVTVNILETLQLPRVLGPSPSEVSPVEGNPSVQDREQVVAK